MTPGLEDMMLASHERRQYERLGLSQGSAFVVFRPEFTKIGPINDISRGGLGFTYLSQSDNEVPASETSQIIDIIASYNSFHLSNIPCTLVYDVKADNDQFTLMPYLANRFRGLKFDQLTEEQEKQINHFLETDTVGNA
jgi:c-di-GMP-binding flagellar brake protein YcgR